MRPTLTAPVPWRLSCELQSLSPPSSSLRRLSCYLLTLFGCSTPTPIATPKVLSVTIDQGDRSLPIGGSVDLSATVEVEGSATPAVTWWTDDADIAEVDATGTVTGVALGVTRITATSDFDGNKHDSIQVSVGDPAAPLWTEQFGTSAAEQARAVATDGAGNVFVAGSTMGDLEHASAGGADVIVRKFGADGAVAWTRQFGTAVDDVAYAVATDAAGNAFVAGVTQGGLEGASNGGTDVFVRKLDPDGTTVWTRQFGTTMNEDLWGVAIDAAGNVFLAGGTGGGLEGFSTGGFDVYVRKYDADGTEDWTHQFGTFADEGARGVTTDAAGNVVVAGFTKGGMQGASAGESDVFVRKLTPAGTPLWTHQFGTAVLDSARGVATDAVGNILVTGYTEGSIEGTSAGDDDVFVRKLDPDGSEVWTRQFGTSSKDRPGGVATDADGNVIVAGYTAGDIMGTSAGDDDVFVRWLDASGAATRTEQFGSSAADLARGVATDSANNVFVAGETAGSLVGAAAGSYDVFVRKYAP